MKQSFDDVKNYLSNIPRIHYGGCGISALAMYKWLKKHKQVASDFKFVLLYDSYENSNYINNQEVLRNKNGKACAPAHVCLYNNGVYFDCNDNHIKLSEYKYVQHVKDVWFIKNCINNKGSWNNCFDRRFVDDIENWLGVKLMIK